MLYKIFSTVTIALCINKLINSTDAFRVTGGQYATIYALNNEIIDLNCTDKLDSCIILHPNEEVEELSQYNPHLRSPPLCRRREIREQEKLFVPLYQHPMVSISKGINGQTLPKFCNRFTKTCKVKIQANKNSIGQWRCFIKNEWHEESLVKFDVKIANEFVALRPDFPIFGNIGTSVILECAVVKENVPLKSCRFVPPNDQPFYINSSIMFDNRLSGKYYFKNGASLKQGDCTLVIGKVEDEDIGVWTCIGELENGREVSDILVLKRIVWPQSTTIINTTRIISGILAICITVLIGVGIWLRLRSRNLLEQMQDLEMQDFILARCDATHPKADLRISPLNSRSL